MSNISIVTMDKAINYGAALQAYALKMTIESITGADVSFVNFVPIASAPTPHTETNVRTLKSFIKMLRNTPRSIINKRNQSICERNFGSFQKRYLPQTQVYRSMEELYTNPPISEILISGSDQVFNTYNRHFRFFYLSFSKEGQRLIAYAPSFGRHVIQEDQQLEIKQYLERFDYLSCREEEGSRLIKHLTGREVPTLLDPVFLLPAEQWRQIECIIPKIQKPYILCYALVGYQKQLEIAREIQKNYGLPIVLIHQRNIPKFKQVIQIKTAGPEEFLWLFSNAEMVVTDSFHGTAFSIIFNKQFYNHIALTNKSSRIINILNKAQIERRIIESDYRSMLKEEIDYNAVNDILKDEVNTSMKYLRNALSTSTTRI